MKLKEKIENLTRQQEAAKELFIKCQGAIEVLTEMLNEKSKTKSKD
jgi:hypothetical protein